VVEAIGIFTTELKSPDNKKVIIPNAKVTGDNIVNYSAKDQRRVDIVAGVSYSDDLDKVRKVLEGILFEDERILQEPAPTIGVLELADSSVNFAVRPLVKTADYWDVFFAVQEKIKKRFDAEGITIPFPQQYVHIHKEE
jgi:small conductance mechanosensitive channel